MEVDATTRLLCILSRKLQHHLLHQVVRSLEGSHAALVAVFISVAQHLGLQARSVAWSGRIQVFVHGKEGEASIVVDVINGMAYDDSPAASFKAVELLYAGPKETDPSIIAIMTRRFMVLLGVWTWSPKVTGSLWVLAMQS